ncbi:MAG: GNAT family N-acetyltransferase [Verrucomicrobia bacterium]|nr:GNAT family N-acetyltransferase [Verrucomicrobiota bacterium]
MSLSVRVAHNEDISSLRQLIDQVVAFHYQEAPTQFKDPAAVLSGAYLEERLADPQAIVLVAECNRAQVGVAVALIREAPPILTPNRVVLVENLAVEPRFRRTGVGRQLMDAAILWAQAQGITELDLNVYEFNTDAIRFYEALGFKTVSRRMRLSVEPYSPEARPDGNFQSEKA